MTQRMSCQSVLVVLLIMELLVSFGIGFIFYHRKEIVYVTSLRYPFLYFGIWGVRAVLVGLILIGVALRNLRLCRITWVIHLPIVLMTMFTVAPLMTIHCACTDYWDCHAVSTFTNLADDFLNPFIPPQAQMAQDGRHFSMKKPPSAQETALTQLRASETLRVRGSHKHRKPMRHKPTLERYRWKGRSEWVNSHEKKLDGHYCEELPEEFQRLPVKEILKKFGAKLQVRVAASAVLWFVGGVGGTPWETKVADLVKKCMAGAEQPLCEEFSFTITVNKAEGDQGQKTICLEWDSKAADSVPEGSETANSISFFYDKIKDSELMVKMFHNEKAWELATEATLENLVIAEYTRECRCDPVLNEFASCNAYHDKSFSQKFWCYIDPKTKFSCLAQGFELSEDSKGHLWTEDLCQRIHADGDGCKCAGFGIKRSLVKMQQSIKTPMEKDTKDEWRFGSYCDVWAADQKQFCFVGFDSTCSDRQLVDFAMEPTKGHIYQSTLPCVKQHQSEALRDAHEYCMNFSWSLLFGILFFNGFCAWTSLAVFRFIANRCGDEIKSSADQYAAESDDDDTWDVTTG